MAQSAAKPRITARQRIAAELARQIRSGKLGPHGRLEGEIALAERFQVSRGTMRAALDDLVRAGIISRTSGRGTFATDAGNTTVRPLVLLLKDVDKVQSQVVTHLIQGIVPEAEQRNSFLALQHRSPADWSPALLANLGGVIVMPHGATPSDLAQLSSRRIPTLLATESELDGPGMSLGIESVSEELAQRLLALGHRHFALISGHSRHADLAKKHGIRTALERAGLDFSQTPDLPTNYSQDAGYRTAHELLTLSPRPTAVIAFNDMLAVQMITVARQQGLSIPDDLSVVGLNNAPFSSMIDPALCSADIPYTEAGRRAAELLLSGSPIRGDADALRLTSRVIWRKSAGPAPKPTQRRSRARVS